MIGANYIEGCDRLAVDGEKPTRVVLPDQVNNLKVGDVFTIDGMHLTPNPDRKWWQIWKPREVLRYGSQRYKVVSL